MSFYPAVVPFILFSACLEAPKANEAREVPPDTGDHPPASLSDEHARLVEDLVRVHQEVFDRLVLFSISEEDCEYPRLDTYGPADFIFRAEDYPYPAINGVLGFTATMTEDGSHDLWSMNTTYSHLSAGEALSGGARPNIDGAGEWTVKAPGRNHTLAATITHEHDEELPLELQFIISDYRSGGYRFAVTGRLGDALVETTVTSRSLCATDG